MCPARHCSLLAVVTTDAGQMLQSWHGSVCDVAACLSHNVACNICLLQAANLCLQTCVTVNMIAMGVCVLHRSQQQSCS